MGRPAAAQPSAGSLAEGEDEDPPTLPQFPRRATRPGGMSRIGKIRKGPFLILPIRTTPPGGSRGPGGSATWDWELDGSGLEDIPVDVGILTVSETAKLLRISEGAVCELVHTRQMSAMRIGTRIRIGRPGLLAFLQGVDADGFDALIKRHAEREVL